MLTLQICLARLEAYGAVTGLGDTCCLHITVTDALTTHCGAMTALRKALTEWYWEDEGARKLYEDSSEDFNIGDWLCEETLDESVMKHLRNNGITNVVLRQVDHAINPGEWHYDTRLINPELHKKENA